MRRLALILALAGCTPSAVVDGGVDGSADVTFDGPLACAADASTPNLDDAGNIDTIQPTHAPHQNACTSQQIADYAQCQGAKATSLCTQFKAGQPGEACGACIETQKLDPEWGVIVFSGQSSAFFNVEGCVNVALGQNGQPDSCGQELHNLYSCQETVCSSCTGVDFSNCELETLQDACVSYDQTVFSPTGLCSALTGDAAPADATNCFPDSSISDPTQQEIDWLTRIVGYLCGP